jgi:hypothetical protein
VTVRLDDPLPDAEAQVDFFYAGRCVDLEAGRARKLYAFLMTLSHDAQPQPERRVACCTLG